MIYLPKQLEHLGIEQRFALDIGSVIVGVRPRGLLHVSVELQHGLEKLLKSYGLCVEATRNLYRGNDPTSREGVLNHLPCEPTDELWCEVWYSGAGVAPIDQAALFGSPGKFLGYPECCRRSLEGKDALARLYQRYLLEDSYRYWELNRLATLFHSTVLMPDFFPCSMSCESARLYVIPFHDVAVSVFTDDYLSITKNAMRAPITIIGNKVVQWSDWKFDKKHLRVAASGARKEPIDRISSYLSITEPSTALLVGFSHLPGLESVLAPNKLTINVNGRDAVDMPLKLI